VREIARLGGPVEGLVPDIVQQRLKQKIGGAAVKLRRIR